MKNTQGALILNRRQFIKTALATAVASQIPGALVPDYGDKMPILENLNAFPIKFQLDGDFTLSFWTKKSNDWMHIAMTKANDDVNVFVNGESYYIDTKDLYLAKYDNVEQVLSNINIFDKELSKKEIVTINKTQKELVKHTIPSGLEFHSSEKIVLRS